MRLSFIIIAIVLVISFTNFAGNIATILVMIAASLAVFYADGLKGLGGRGIPYLLLFYAIVIIYGFLGFGSLNEITFRGWLFNAISCVCVFVISAHIRRLTHSQIQKLVFISLLAFLLCTIITLSIAASNPMALRLYGMGELSKNAVEGEMYRSMGMMSYASAHSIVAFSTGVTILLLYSANRTIRLISFILLMLMVVLMFTMTITTALLLTVISTLMIAVYKFSNGRIVMSISLVAIMGILILSSNAIINILGFAEESNVEIFAKLNDLHTTIQTGTGSGQMGYREDLYSTSFNTFLSNPLFGGAIDDGSRNSIGQHSFIMDTFAFFGLWGLIYFYAVWKEYKSAYCTKTNKVANVLYNISFAPSILLMGLKAESVCSQLLFVLLIFIPLTFRVAFDNPVTSKGTIS